jgi:hypothetical protein
VEEYVSDFQRLLVMVTKILEKRHIVLFTKGFLEQLKGLVKAFHPNTSRDYLKSF